MKKKFLLKKNIQKLMKFYKKKCVSKIRFLLTCIQMKNKENYLYELLKYIQNPKKKRKERKKGHTLHSISEKTRNSQ